MLQHAAQLDRQAVHFNKDSCFETDIELFVLNLRDLW